MAEVNLNKINSNYKKSKNSKNSKKTNYKKSKKYNSNPFNKLFKGKCWINLDNNKFSIREFNQICRALKNNPQVKSLSLVNCEIDNTMLIKLAKINTLISLNLNDNFISDDGACLLAENNSIRDLGLCINYVSNYSIRKILNKNKIKRIALSSTNVNKRLFSAFMRNTSLIDIYIDDTDISKSKVRKIKRHINNNKNRRKLCVMISWYIAEINLKIPKYYPIVLLRF